MSTNGQRKIMIVEDDEDLHVLYGLYLQGQDYEILRAYNGQEAFDILEKEKPRLIILDMIMPVMDGEEFFVKLRTEKKIADIPVIIASVNDKISPKLLNLGNIHAILKKPFTIETLVQHIEQALSNGAKR
ncbi:MAG TPA: response regulator [Verrucomicrobiae bacterium]|jgi:DNA-binding response OmpR family regulator|nr:response regulator [Verrucomicrobiae bacterium]